MQIPQLCRKVRSQREDVVAVSNSHVSLALADAKSVQEHEEYAFYDSMGSCEVAGEIRLLKNLGQVKLMGIWIG